MRVSDRTYFVLKRLHSLTGIVPIGLFLLEHFFTNSQALRGATAFNKAAADLGGLPYVVLIEALGIWLPIAFHAVLGVIIATTWQANVGRYGYARNWQYFLQRVSGIILVFFILFHTWMTRFNSQYLHGDAYLFVQQQIANPGTFLFYVVGILSACWHMGNGLFGFAIHWGLATGIRAQRWAARVGFAVFVVLSLVGLNALLGFTGHGIYPDWLQKPHGRVESVVWQGGSR